MDDNDHDILIRVEANLTGLCNKLDQIDEDNKQEHKDIRDMIDRNYKDATKSEKAMASAKTKQVAECNNRFVHTKTFLWIAGFIIMGVIGAYGFTSMVQKDLTTHQIEYKHEKVEKDENRLSNKDKN